ncbi:MAG: hypothetical protein IKI70_05810 [Bacteroidales bacterium]|nr:hypothetical protein [Bacteroidales bacterium]
MDRKKTEQEHAQLKERLQELTDFINSEEYYKLSEAEKQLIAAQRSGMEVYINALSIRLWGKDSTSGSYSPSLLGLMTSLLFAPSFGSSIPPLPKKDEDIPKDE